MRKKEELAESAYAHSTVKIEAAEKDLLKVQHAQNKLDCEMYTK